MLILYLNGNLQVACQTKIQICFVEDYSLAIQFVNGLSIGCAKLRQST